uniref:Uncharacterized protein n=1 Tax=Anopheles minimus TaxID=112268 RepID=A0A182W5C9_9DIPT
MDSKPKPDEWRISIARRIWCTLCRRSLRLPCPHCEGRNLKEPCWVMFNKKSGNCHRHCCTGYNEDE